MPDFLSDPASTGRLFYEYLRVKTILEDNAAAWGEPFFWLFENTFHMELATREEISKFVPYCFTNNTCCFLRFNSEDVDVFIAVFVLVNPF